ncbi:putative F-box protein SKIP23-like [Cocos nucifera]|uniref:Putative F-box protein SKIP23-like n=1 Tax=Cocos nucifera TaxID=13894 RepID=A0A8K0IEL2_COCNU|nr:putative F-box protein SKIP23-like [Cocos nucifera]
MDCMVVITSCYPSIGDISFCKLGEEFYKNRYWIYEFFPKNQLNLSRNRRLSLVKSLLDKPRFRSWFLYQNFIVCTKNISGCQEDCIYVDVSEPGEFVYEYEIDDDAHEIDVLNLKTGNYEHISCGRKEPRSRKLHSVWVELSL